MGSTGGVDVFFQSLFWSLGFGRQADNAFVVFGHGDEAPMTLNGLKYGLNTEGNSLNGFDPQAVFNWIEAQEGYNSSQTIQLNFCFAGDPQGLAKAISKLRSAPVCGPSSTISGFGGVDTDPGDQPWNCFSGGNLVGH